MYVCMLKSVCIDEQCMKDHYYSTKSWYQQKYVNLCICSPQILFNPNKNTQETSVYWHACKIRDVRQLMQAVKTKWDSWQLNLEKFCFITSFEESKKVTFFIFCLFYQILCTYNYEYYAVGNKGLASNFDNQTGACLWTKARFRDRTIRFLFQMYCNYEYIVRLSLVEN